MSTFRSRSGSFASIETVLALCLATGVACGSKQQDVPSGGAQSARDPQTTATRQLTSQQGQLDLKRTAGTSQNDGLWCNPKQARQFPDSARTVQPSGTATTFKDDGREIDTLIVYTAMAKRDMESDGLNVADEIRKAVAEANQTMANNHIDLKINLVYVQQVGYTERTDAAEEDIDIIADEARGAEIRTLRDQHRADHVGLIRYWKNGQNKSYVTGSIDPASLPIYAKTAISTIRNDCFLTGWHCFTHELGHVLGAQHDRQAAEFPGLFPDSYGYDFKAPSANGGAQVCFGTMMDYLCADHRILFFSDPNVMYQGQPVGVAGKNDNARAIREAKQFVANFRQRNP